MFEGSPHRGSYVGLGHIKHTWEGVVSLGMFWMLSVSDT